MNIGTIIQNIRLLPFRKISIAFGIVFAVIIGLNIILKGDEFTITRIGIPASNTSVEAVGDSLYAYNGANFYKQGFKSQSEPKILGGGVKLPLVTEAFWAKEKGVLLNFDQSTISTEVSTVATRLNLSYTQERSSTWYFDFSDNSLNYVGSFQLMPNVHYYDEKSGVINFIEERDGLPIFHSYNLANRQDTPTLLASDFTTVTAISTCFDNTKEVCITGRLNKSPQLTGVYSSTEGGIKAKYELDGEIYPTPDSPWIITLNNADDDSDLTDGSIAQYKKAVAINLQTKDKININQSFGPGNFLYSVYDKENIAMIGIGGFKYVTTGTLSGIKYTSEQDLKYTDGTNFETSPIVEFYPQKDVILFSTTDGQKNIFARKDSIKNTFLKVSQKQALKKLQICAGGVDVEWQEDVSTFTVFLLDTATFKDEIKRVSDCIVKEKLTNGYLFTFTSVDPESGRPTSY